VSPRAITRWYQTAARAWLTLAGLALLLPASDRRGLWLPLHLALAGAVATAISGAMQNFMLALTATPAPPAVVTWVQFALLTAGAATIAIGLPNGLDGVVAVGGTAWIVAIVLLGWMLWRARRRSLHRRHGMPIAAYAAAIVSAVAGGTIGALLGSGALDGDAYLRARHAHLTLNVLGFASLTVVGTLVTLLPTVLRVRMPPRRGGGILTILVAALVLLVVAWLADATALLTAGGVAFAIGALGVASLMLAIVRSERRWKPPAAAMHMVAAIAWFVVGSMLLAWALAHGASGFDDFRTTFLVAFVGGWLLQVLLGAWAYLLPMQRPGHPDERRRTLAVFEVAAPVQLVVLNAGLLVLATRGAGWVGDAVGDLGVVLTAAGAGAALLKAWAFPSLGRAALDTGRARAVWGGDPADTPGRR
jgi:nitrite reductase (NO-forming)